MPAVDKGGKALIPVLAVVHALGGPVGSEHRKPMGSPWRSVRERQAPISVLHRAISKPWVPFYVPLQPTQPSPSVDGIMLFQSVIRLSKTGACTSRVVVVLQSRLCSPENFPPWVFRGGGSAAGETSRRAHRLLSGPLCGPRSVARPSACARTGNWRWWNIMGCSL